jgi:hypothetical protein
LKINNNLSLVLLGFLTKTLGKRSIKYFSKLRMISRSLVRAYARMGLARFGSKTMPIMAAAPQRLMSSGHHDDIMDPKLYPKGMSPATWDEYPVPAGDWEEHNNKLQSKYNKQLAAGILIFIGTLIYLFNCPQVDFVMAPKSIGVNPPAFSAYAPGQSPRDKK